MLTLGLDIHITKATSMADMSGSSLAWTTCLAESARAAIALTPLKAVPTERMQLPKRKLEKAKAVGVAKALRTVISGWKVSVKRVPSALANVMMPKRGSPLVELQLPLPLEADQSQEDEGRGKVVAVPLVLHVVQGLREEGPCTAGDLVDLPKDQVQAVRSIDSGESILALGVTPEQREARVEDTFKTNVIPEGASSDTRVPADIPSVKVFALRAIDAITHMSRSLKSREGANLRGNILLIRNKPPTLDLRVESVAIIPTKKGMPKLIWPWGPQPNRMI